MQARQPKVNILLVDDYPPNLVALSAVLSDPVYHLIEATSGSEAIRLAEENSIALILLDIQMPGMDGYEVARLLRQNQRTRDIPIIFITAVYREDPSIRKGYEVGGQDFIGKPFDPAVLKAKVGIYSGKFQRIAELEEAVTRLKESEERYRLIIEGAQDIIATIDFTGTITSLNIAFEKLTGFPCSEWVGKSFVPLITPNDLPGVLEKFGESARHDEARLLQTRMRAAGGLTIPVEISIQPLLRDGRMLGTVGVIRDISDRASRENGNHHTT